MNPTELWSLQIPAVKLEMIGADSVLQPDKYLKSHNEQQDLILLTPFRFTAALFISISFFVTLLFF